MSFDFKIHRLGVARAPENKGNLKIKWNDIPNVEFRGMKMVPDSCAPTHLPSWFGGLLRMGRAYVYLMKEFISGGFMSKWGGDIKLKIPDADVKKIMTQASNHSEDLQLLMESENCETLVPHFSEFKKSYLKLQKLLKSQKYPSGYSKDPLSPIVDIVYDYDVIEKIVSRECKASL